MRFLHSRSAVLGVIFAALAFFWTVVEFFATPYWERFSAVPEQSDDQAIGYIREMHQLQMQALRREVEDQAERERIAETTHLVDQLNSVEGQLSRFDLTYLNPVPRLAERHDVQARMQQVVDSASVLFDTESIFAALMDVNSGEIFGIAESMGPDSSTVLGRQLFEPGSVLKPLTAIIALQEGIYSPSDEVPFESPLVLGRFSIRDFSESDEAASFHDSFVRSSNVVPAGIALEFGADTQRSYLSRLGLLSASPVEVREANYTLPLFPREWSSLSTATISYGHGLALSAFHLLGLYGTIANGGELVAPSLIFGGRVRQERVFSSNATEATIHILRDIVQFGAGSLAAVDGLGIAGVGGTSDKPNPQGGYFSDRTISSFVSIVPVDNPRFVLIVVLDEPRYIPEGGGPERRTSGWTAAPVSSAILQRLLSLPDMASAMGFSGSDDTLRYITEQSASDLLRGVLSEH
jgi:cell division protein FtsI (penicillin-binding protein 3)